MIFGERADRTGKVVYRLLLLTVSRRLFTVSQRESLLLFVEIGLRRRGKQVRQISQTVPSQPRAVQCWRP